jgi:lipopolysaccharide export system protein LptA
VGKRTSLVDLKTAGEITLDADDVTGDAFISAGSVKLEADQLDIYLSGGAVKYLIEATDEQNGEISLKKTGSLNSFDLDNGNNINVTEAFFKAKDTFLSSNGNSNSNSSSGRIVLVGETIAEGNLELETVKDVTICAKKTAVKGNLAVNAENGYGVEITSEGGTVSTGSTEITAPSLFVTLQANGDAAIIEGNAKINANKISMQSANNAAIAGDAKLQAQNDITLLGGTLQTQNDIVKYSDGGENWVQIMATGETYDADNCEHPILAGYSGRCMVCGASDIEYAELIGTDGTTKRMLNGDFGGTGAHNDFRYLEDGDTIKFVKDIYGNGRTAAIGDSKAVTLDLNGHTLILDTISSGNYLTIANGNYKGKITNSGVGLTKELTFKNAKAALNDLQWMTNSGVKLEGSEVTVSGNDGSGQCWLEKLTMDEDSKLVLKNVSQGISNYANVALEESLGTIRGFLPKDFSIANRKRNPADVDYRNTIVDADGQIAQNVELRYRKMTDADLSATLNPTTYIYDGTAKEPEVLVVYDGQTLTKDTDYTVAYSDNKNAGSAEVTITGIGVYHEAAHLQFTIGKAGQAAPTGLKAVNTSKTGASDGAIENLTTAMEYSTDEIHWTKVTDGTKINQLTAGDYFVRYAETGNYLASASTKVTVAVKEDPSTGNGSNTVALTGTTQKTATIKTGDETPVGRILLLMFSAAGLLVVAAAGRKKYC